MNLLLYHQKSEFRIKVCKFLVICYGFFFEFTRDGHFLKIILEKS